MISTPTISILYDSVNISESVDSDLIALTYTDNVEGESDEVVIELDDSKGRWRESWYPDKGATLEVEIQMDGTALPCGSFVIEEIDFRFAPDTVSIRAMGAGASKALRSKRSRAYEDVTLKDIAQRIADAYGLKLEGDIRPVQFKRRTQHRQEDLAFLHGLAIEFGYTFSVRGDRLVFTSLDSIESASAALTIYKSDVASSTFADRSIQVYKSALVRYHNPATNKLIESDAAGNESGSADSFEIRSRAESVSQASESAKGAMKRTSTKRVEAMIALGGRTNLMAGINIELAGFGSKLSGLYHVLRSTHSVTNSGYTTSAELKRIE